MNEEMKALLKKAEDSIKGAKILFEDELYGFAASRAYYEQKFHQYLVEAFEQRQIGDYEPLEEITEETAQKSIDHALEFLNAVKDYLSEYSGEKERK